VISPQPVALHRWRRLQNSKEIVGGFFAICFIPCFQKYKGGAFIVHPTASSYSRQHKLSLRLICIFRHRISDRVGELAGPLVRARRRTMGLRELRIEKLLALGGKMRRKAVCQPTTAPRTQTGGRAFIILGIGGRNMLMNSKFSPLEKVFDLKFCLMWREC